MRISKKLLAKAGVEIHADETHITFWGVNDISDKGMKLVRDFADDVGLTGRETDEMIEFAMDKKLLRILGECQD